MYLIKKICFHGFLKEDILAVAASNVEQEARDEPEDEIDDGAVFEEEDQRKKGKKLVPADSLRRYREKLYKTDHD